MTLVFVQGRYNKRVQGTSLRLPSPVGGEPSIRSDAEVIMICLCSQWHPLVATSRVGLLCTLGYIYAVVDVLMYWWWLRPVVSAVCMLRMSSPVTVCRTHDRLHQPIRLTVVATNSLYMTTDDPKQQVAIELLQPTRDYLFRVFCIICCTIVVIPYAHTQLHCLLT